MADDHPSDLEIRRRVSPSIVDFQVRLMDGIGELVRQLGESLEVELIDRYGYMLDKQGGERAPLGDQQPTGDGASSHESGSRVALPTGNGLMFMRAPQRPGLPENATDSVDAGLRACVCKLPPLKSLQESSDMSRVDKLAPRCETGLLHTSCVVEASHESAQSQEPGLANFVDDTQNLIEENDIPANQLRAVHLASSTPTMLPRGPLLHRIVKSNLFEIVFIILILLNCALLGVEAHESVQRDMRPWMVEVLAVAEHLFTILFLIELVLRATVFGCGYFSPTREGNLLVFFDALLVIFPGIVFTWVVPICAAIGGFNSGSETVRSFSVLRASRMLRMVRVMQRLPMFREATLLVSGLTNSARTLFWTCSVLAFVTYVFAIFGLKFIVKDLQDQYHDTVDGTTAHKELGELLLLFGGLDACMYTMIQVLMGDSFHAITRVVLKYIGWSWLYFYSYIAVANFVMMNLVTAVIVDNCLSCSRQNEYQEAARLEREKKKELQDMQSFFFTLGHRFERHAQLEGVQEVFQEPRDERQVVDARLRAR